MRVKKTWLKVDDVVDIRDSSYAIGVKNSCYSTYPEPRRCKGVVVIDTGLTIVRNIENYEKRWNCVCDIAVRDIDGGVWFLPSDQVDDATKHEIIIDGKKIEMSRESYENLKKQLT